MIFETLLAWGLIFFAPMIFAYAGSSDLFNMRLSNRLVGFFLLPFPLFAYGISLPWIDVIMHVGVGMLVLGVCFFFWSRGWIGGGDAKFAAVTAIWLGPELSLIFFVMTSVYGALLSIFFLFFRANWLPGFLLKMDWATRLHDVKKIPYGVALSVAGLQIYSMSDWMREGVSMLAG